MDLVEQQYKTRNNITPRNLVTLPLSVSVSNPEDHNDNCSIGYKCFGPNKTRIDAHLDREWVRSVDSHQFWAFQYNEHAEMIALITQSLGSDWNNFTSTAEQYKEYWLDLYNNLMNSNDMRIPETSLLQFRAFKLTLLKKLIEKFESGEIKWIGWAPLSLYEHMAREVEYILEPRTATRVLSFWLTDMEGHAALDSAWTDPAHEDLVKKAKQIAEAYAELKKNVGQGEGRGFFNLLARRDADTTDKELQEIIIFGEKVERLEAVKGDLRETLARLIILQNGLTAFHLEYKRLADAGKLFTTMPPTFIVHTLRESMRANYELEELAKGRIVP